MQSNTKSLPHGLFSPICLETFHCFLSFMLQMGTPVTSSSTASSNSESLSASSKALFPSTAQVRRKLQFKIVKWLYKLNPLDPTLKLNLFPPKIHYV